MIKQYYFNYTYFVALYVRNNERNTNIHTPSERGKYNLQNKAKFSTIC